MNISDCGNQGNGIEGKLTFHMVCQYFIKTFKDHFCVMCSMLHNEGLAGKPEVRTLSSELSSLGLNPGPAINCHPGVLQEG